MMYNTMDYVFETDTQYDVKITTIEKTQTLIRIGINVDFHKELKPEPIRLTWKTQGGGIHTRWDCMSVQNRRLYPNWEMTCNESRSASGMPLQCYIGKNGMNRVTVAVSDVKTPIQLRSGFVEENAQIAWELVLFSQPIGKISDYSTELIIDTDNIPYSESIGRVKEWWRKWGYTDSDQPEAAFEPVYSTWYSYHQNVTPDSLLKELESASKLGMKTVIVDDGWQTDDNSRGYAYCGEWSLAETKIPDMKDFADKVHGLGMKLMLWFSVPYVGIHSNVFECFKDKLLDPGDHEHFVLDPRYKEVREYLVSAYERAVEKWGIDGLKLDFIDSFKFFKESTEFSPHMDTGSVEDGVCMLLDEVYTKLTSIKPDILIEFRQSYVGPVMLKYGNMFRAFDCPMDPVTNRVSIVNLRLTSGKRAVHSDMIMWDNDEPTETAADKLINVLFSVPQISVRINELSRDHYKMLKYYLSFWNENKEVLAKGKLCAKNPEANFSLVNSELNGKMVAVAYSDRVLKINKHFTSISFVNGTGDDRLYIETLLDDAEYQYSIYNCTGDLIERGNAVISRGINEFSVPESGLISFSKMYDS